MSACVLFETKGSTLNPVRLNQLSCTQYGGALSRLICSTCGVLDPAEHSDAGVLSWSSSPDKYTEGPFSSQRRLLVQIYRSETLDCSEMNGPISGARMPNGAAYELGAAVYTAFIASSSAE